MPHKHQGHKHKHHPSKRKAESIITDPSGMEGFKEITDFRNTKKDSTFWIIGSDPNLDFYPDDFFDDKLSIAIGVSCVAFPNSMYFIIASTPILEAIRYSRADFLTKCILPLSYHRTEPRPYWLQLNPYWGDFGLDPIYLKLMEGSQESQTITDWEKMIEQIFGDGPIRFVQPYTTAHYAIASAAVLGAKKIILVGCSHKLKANVLHAQKRGMWIFCLENRFGGKRGVPLTNEWLDTEFALMRRDTIRFKEAFAKYGVEVVRHRFDEDRGEFVFEEIGAA